MSLDLPLIVEPDRLEDVLGHVELMLVDVSQPRTYSEVHIPGAVHVNPAELVCGIQPATGKLPSREQLNQLFSRIGYSPDKHIVVYDDEGGGWAGRFIWTLDVIGHEGYSYLNGGLHAWYKEGHPVTSEVPEVEPTEVALTIDDTVIASLEDVLESLDKPGVKIWDARSREEYLGQKVTARRGGHIPGAVNLDWLDTMDKSRNLRLLPMDELRHRLETVGIRQGDEIITHCQTHHRSGLTYLIARILGHKARGYDGSWAEWGNLPDTPIETDEPPAA